MATAPIPRRGDVWLIDFDPSVGAEIQKIRPAVVISVTDWKSHYSSFPWFVRLPASSLNGLAKDSGADAFQTKSVALSRFVDRLGELTSSQLDEIAEAIALCVGVP